MNKRLTLAVAAFLMVAGAYFYAVHTTPSDTPLSEEDSVLFLTISGYGPCPPDRTCGSKLRLFHSGVLEIDSVQKKVLSEEEIQNIRAYIRKSGIMSKRCDAQEVMDVTTGTYISLDGKAKEIGTLGCEEEVRAISEFIQTFVQKSAE